MTLDQVLKHHQIKTAPEEWINHWGAAQKSYNGVPFVGDDYIKEANSLLRLSEERVGLLCEAASFFRATPEGRSFIWLWYYTALSLGSKIEESIHNWPVPPALPKHLSGMPYALALLGFIPGLRAFYAQKGISEDIMVDTLGDFSLWMDEHRMNFGYCGIGAFSMGWLVDHFSGKLFGLGRLQFIVSPFKGDGQIARGDSGLKWFAIDAPLPKGYYQVLKPGDLLLDVHIPRRGPLDYAACAKSYGQALDFYKKHFPEMDIKGFICGSWLLSPKLKEILSPESNIHRFSSDYFVYKTTDYDRGLYSYVFRVKEGEDLPEKTSLQRAIKKHLAGGGCIGTGEGVIIKQKLHGG